MADSIISVIFLIILSFISIFEVRTYMQYVFEKSLTEIATTQVIEKHDAFSEILYVYPWKYIKRYRFIFLLFQIMYFSCIVSTILVVKTILLNYLQNRDFWNAIRYNNIAISAVPMMICILIAPIIYFILRQCWGKGRVEIEKEQITKDLNWTTFTVYSYPFTYRYYRAREKYFSKSPNDRDFEFDNMELIMSDFFDQIINAYNSYEDISYNPVEYLQKPTHIFFHLLNDFQQRCNEQDIENTEEIVAYYRSELDNKHLLQE